MPFVVVNQGDHLSRIAKQYGFADYRTIWNHPENAELKKARVNPHVLYPGDRLFLPERQLREESGATDQKHQYVVRTPELMLRVVLENVYEHPIASARCELRGDVEAELTTDGDARLERPISPLVRNLRLTVREQRTAICDTALPLRVGDLDPVEETSGQQARLNNLGYYTGPVGRPDARLLKLAIEEFQCENSLVVDGICGPNTQRKLKEVHGS